jgi:hypothetical protein
MRGHRSNERDYYRVDCRAVVALAVVGDRIPGGRNAESFFGEAEQFNMLRELRRIDQESSSVLHQIGEQDRLLGSYLHVLNRKIDALARHLTMLSPELRDGAEQTVSISEGGIGFVAGAPPAAGSLVAVRVMLLPEGTAFAVFGRILTVQPQAGGGSMLSVNFENLQEAERQLIARHVMQVQMAEQRRRAGRS